MQAGSISAVVCMQANVLLRNIEQGVAVFNNMWEQWIDPQHAPVCDIHENSGILTIYPGISKSIMLSDSFEQERQVCSRNRSVSCWMSAVRACRWGTNLFTALLCNVQARMTYQAHMVAPDLLVEVDAIAAVPSVD